MRRRALRFTLCAAQEGLRPHHERSLVFPIGRIILKGVNFLRARTFYTYADPGVGRQLLVSEGFEVTSISLVPRQTPLPGHILEWLRLFTTKTTFFKGIGLDETEAMLGEVADACEIDAKDTDSDRWMIMYVRLRVLAKRKV